MLFVAVLLIGVPSDRALDQVESDVASATHALSLVTLSVITKESSEYGDKIDAAEKAAIEGASKELETALKGSDKAEIEAKTEALGKASQKLGEKMYADMQAKAQAESGGGAGPTGPGPAPGAEQKEKDMGNVVDAEFTEVKDKKG